MNCIQFAGPAVLALAPALALVRALVHTVARTALRTVLRAAVLALPLAAAAAPVTYEVDPSHTFPSFEADHMGISVWRGKLNATTGTVRYDKADGSGSVELRFDPASIDFGQAQLNTWARGPEFFDVKRFPEASYKGRFAGGSGGVPAQVVGDLTLHGVTRPVTLTIERLKCVAHPMFKRELCGADASASFDRAGFGLTAGKDYGFRMDVGLRIQVEAIAAP